MKKSMKGLVVVVLTTFLVMGCVDRKPKQVAEKDAAAVEETNNDSTVYGVCGDGTAMHTLQIISRRYADVYAELRWRRYL